MESKKEKLLIWNNTLKSMILIVMFISLVACSNGSSSEVKNEAETSSGENSKIKYDKIINSDGNNNEEEINEMANNEVEAEPLFKDRKYYALNGSSIEIDPTWPYYRHRSPESIADEIELAGYKAVHYNVVNEKNINGNLIKAFHDRDIAVWMLVFGNGSYSMAGFPKDWEDWKMELIKPSDVAGFSFLSPFSKPYVQWKKEVMVAAIEKYPFDGIEIMEPFFPEWSGLESGVYGDVGPNAIAAFKEKYNSEIPDFIDSQSPNYYRTNTELYDQWIEFRVNGVNDFLYEIFNGEGGIRAANPANPDIVIATWSLAVDGGMNSVGRLRELQGLDAAEMISRVEPDIHFFQTHWPDWIKPESALPADYMKKYKPFIDQVRERHPDIPLGIQMDNGSLTSMIKSAAWQKQLNVEIPKYGFAAWTTYEYHIGGYMYTEKPMPLRALRGEDGSVMISFNKRIEVESASSHKAYSFFANGEQMEVALTSIEVDGNRVILQSEAFPDGTFEIAIEGIKDTPNLWLYNKDSTANEVPKGSKITVGNR